MSTSNYAEQTLHYDQQIDGIENEIRRLQAAAPADSSESIPPELAASLDDLFIQLHTVIALKCVVTIDPESRLIAAIKHQKVLKVLEVAKLAQLMSHHIEGLHDALAEQDADAQSKSLIKQTIAEFFIARQVLVDTAIHGSSEADNVCDCNICQQSTYHQFTAAFDYVCTHCETAFFK